MKQRLKFINDYLQQDDTMAALCRRYGVQRRIGYNEDFRFGSSDGTSLHPHPAKRHHFST